jgi:hypothetical protein
MEPFSKLDASFLCIFVLQVRLILTQNWLLANSHIPRQHMYEMDAKAKANLPKKQGTSL